ncbi:hypothetical protein [Clostridium aminobutyricum]|uniref:Uncharacterized protein n=1 Tax=Clostridium aminobutyricum TaxID=33953 RepID=A0A939D5Z3_CLOAM|nr:hypothetical protein [Clostridium aminobutyricum]MBN7771979.1 hypothetical protein [Clostridium aminobutyricum]
MANEVKTCKFKVTNGQLIAGTAVPTAVNKLGSEGIKKFAEIVVKEVTAATSVKFIPIVNQVAAAVALIGVINTAFGNSGFNVTVTLKYITKLNPSIGEYVSGYSIDSISVVPY